MSRPDFEHLCNVAKDRFESWREIEKMYGRRHWWPEHRIRFLSEVAAENGLSTRSMLNAASARHL